MITSNRLNLSNHIKRLFSKGLTGPIALAIMAHLALLSGWHVNKTPPLTPHEINILLTPPEQTSPEVINSDALRPMPELTRLSEAIQEALLPKKTLKKKTISEAFHTPLEADYLTRWQTYIEKVGNKNYPSEAYQKNIRGQLRLLVAINRDGSVREVSLRQSSGSPILDQAAIQIVKLAAPFEPLPDHLQDLDVLEIIRTWQFRGFLTAGS